MVKRVLLLLLALPVLAQPVPHAVLNESQGVISDESSPYGIVYTLIDPGLVAEYRNSPAHAAKVANLRLLVIPEQPSHTLQQTVEPNGWDITEEEVTRLWQVRALTSNEIAAANAHQALLVSDELERRITGDAWDRLVRSAYIMSEMHEITAEFVKALSEQLDLVVLGVSNQLAASSSITTPQKQRIVALRSELDIPSPVALSGEYKQRYGDLANELLKIKQLRQAANQIRTEILSTNIVVEAATHELWPDVQIGE